jgi:hypothetical protein
MTPRISPLFWALLVLSLLSWTIAPLARSADSELRKATESLLQGNFSEVKSRAGEALESEPRARLAYWLKAQSQFVLAGKPVELRKRDSDFLQEAKVRLESNPNGKFPKNLVSLPRSATGRPPVLLVDASRSRLYVYGNQNGLPKLLDEFYTSIGAQGFDKLREGDQRTPIGVYRLEREIRNPQGNPLLGDLAMTLDYPNAFDKKSGRTGSGIWIHGVPRDVYVRPPLASDGCLALSNRDLERLKTHVRYGETQIIVVPAIEWIDKESWLANSARAKELFSFVAPESQQGGVFYVERGWPLVVTAVRGNRLERREYFEGSESGLRRVLVEKISS